MNVRKFARTACIPVLVVTLVVLCATSSIRAASIFAPEDGSLFEFVIIPGGESPYYGEGYQETRELTEAELNVVPAAIQYWVNILGSSAKNNTALRISLFGDEDSNASATSDEDQATGLSALARALIDGTIVDTDSGYLATIELGDGLTYYTEPVVWALPRNGDTFNLASTLIHELGHALGISSNMSSYDQYLYDALGRQSQKGMTPLGVESLPSSEDVEDTIFYLSGTGRYSGVYFSGKHVAEVLTLDNGDIASLYFPEDYDSFNGDTYEGTVDGIPINGMEGDDYELSHTELQNSLMSHQAWRNWGIYMEAELALLQDLGFEIDRRQFFGYSIYNDYLENFENTNPYYKRENGQWVVGEPNETAWGIGLHVYGSWNTITQAADILTVGYDATGIRLEGVGNVLTVAEGVRVQSDGQYGTGLLVSYGKNHVVNVEGTVTALGDGGIAARFDFGDNLLGNTTEYRGSYMWRYGEVKLSNDSESMLSKINGPLVTTFNVSGTLMGNLAAIYIAENAYVKELNILSGAYLEGDIVSEWEPSNTLLPESLQNDLFTTLTFGTLLGDDSQGDSDFFLAYSGNVKGYSSIQMTLVGGTLVLGGTADIHSLAMADETTLALVGSDTSTPQVTTTDSVTIGDNATLHTGFTANGKVTGIYATGEVSIGSDVTWTFAALPDFYASNSQIVLASPVTDAASSVSAASFRYHTLLDTLSPTLDFVQLSSTEGANEAIVGVSRAENAYSQYARNKTSYNVGNALYWIAEKEEVSGDMQELLAALDWTEPDGSGVTKGLAQPGPDAYDAVARATLAEQNEFNLLIFRRMLARFAKQNGAFGSTGASHDAASNADTRRAQKASDWEIWATPYGGGAFQDTHGGLSSWKSTGVGLLLGADRHFDSDLSVGGHVALAARRTHVEDGQDARADTKSAFVGLQAFLAPQSWDGFYLTGQGRIGIESGDMERDINIGNYHRSIDARWSGLAGSIMLGGGRDFTVRQDESAFSLGPLAWFEYSFLNRPAFSEKAGEATRLRLGQSIYDSLLMNLGAHAGWQTLLSNGTILGFDVLAAWRHELLDGKFTTSAAFAGYGAYGFESESELSGRDSMLVQSSVRLAGTSGFSANLEAGVELFRKNYTAVNVGLNLAWEF